MTKRTSLQHVGIKAELHSFIVLAPGGSFRMGSQARALDSQQFIAYERIS